MLSNVNLADFDFTGVTPGKGKTGTKWNKWAIVNGYNGAEDFRGRSLRGFDHADSDYNLSAKTGGSDSQTLIIENMVKHRHLTEFLLLDDSFIGGYTPVTGAKGVITQVQESNTGGSGSLDTYRLTLNSGDGTNNINNQDELKSSPDPFSTRNKFTTAVVVQKIS